MIKRWHLKNFKSFRNSPHLEFAQINVLAGANSSGKSSIIQSLLLLKQTVQYGSENRSITFNGPLLRLGGFDDVQHFDAIGENLEIGFDVHFTEQELRSGTVAPWARILRRHLAATEGAVPASLSLRLSYSQRQQSGNLEFKNVARPSSLTPDLRECAVQLSRSGSSESRKISSATYRLRGQGKDTSEDDYRVLDYQVLLDEDSQREVFGDKPDASISGGTLSYFLPSWVAVRYNSSAHRAMRLVDNILNPSTGMIGGPSFVGDELVSVATIEIINQWLLMHDAAAVGRNEPALATDIRKSILAVLQKTRSEGSLFGSHIKPDEKMAAEIGQLKQKILIQFLQETEPTFDLEFEVPRVINASVEFFKEYLKQGVRYLGPLRDSPRPVYQLEALESTTDVGYRGEHTAAVLDLNRDRLVGYYVPPNEALDTDYVTSAKYRRATLHDAVVEWLGYLGVADDVVTTDAGVFGNRLQVATDGMGQLHDLTNVGVGVSQVLPIVVMALLAPRGSLLIFEQPELHLHPKVQARLADFFLALAVDGKQTLLETHSEYLVDRFRLRIALSEQDSVRPLINILFSEKSGGDSSLTPIEISEYGAILNWPKDFFEQSQRDVGRIVKAASAKRRPKAQG